MPLRLASASCVLCLLIVLLPAGVRGQSSPVNVDPSNATGTSPYVTYGGVRENINLATGNLNLQIPLLTLPGRNGQNLSVALEYDSKMLAPSYYWDANTMRNIFLWGSNLTPPAILSPNWRLNLPVLQVSTYDFGSTTGGHPEICLTDFIITMPEGINLSFGNRAACNLAANGTIQPNPSLNINVTDTVDATFYRLDTTNPANIILYSKGGTQYHFFTPVTYSDVSLYSYYFKAADRIEDTNGNWITISSDNLLSGQPTIYSISDSLGRTVSFNSGSGGLASHKDSNGNLQGFSTSISPCTVIYTFVNPPGSGSASSNNYCFSTLTLPNGLTYKFEYNSPLTELTKITYPTGGYARYDYATFTYYWQAPCTFQTPGYPSFIPKGPADFREVTARHVCRDPLGGCTAQTEDTTTYTPTIDGTKTSNQYMDVVDPAGNLTHYSFGFLTNPGLLLYQRSWALYAPRELSRTIYQGKTTVLRTTQTDYNAVNSSGAPTLWALPIRVTTTLNDSNQVTKEEWDYDTYTTPGGASGTPIDNVIEHREFAYGSGAPGALLRRTDYTWLKTNSINGIDYTSTAIHIMDRKLTAKIYDGSGNLMAQSQFEYDNYAADANHAALQASGAVQHDPAISTSYLTRGNVTSAQLWRNTDSTWLFTYTQYDDAGNILKTIDPAGHTVTRSFSDSWANSACAPTGGSAKAYLSMTANALGQTASSTYNSCSGASATTTDSNTQTVQNSYDLMGRLTQTNFPDAGQITRTFNETSTPLSITPTVKITSTANLVPPTVVDGLGRVTQSKLTSDPEGITYTDATYDPLGRKKTVSNPYRTTSDPTYGVTTYNYDALGRVIQVIPPDGTSTSNNISTAYLGNCSTVTDQTGKQRKTCGDALGRLVQVFEPDATGNLVNETDYQYDALNNLLCVHQRGTDTTADKTCTDASVPASWRPRKFTYNSLSQLLTSTNPESGTITYTYNADGLVATKMDARGITTTYFYDVIHRLTKKTYSDTTPQVTYWYDGQTPTGCTPPALTITNGVGRRTAMCDAAGSEVWSYDQMGRVLTEKRTTNGVTKTTGYTYNLDGSLATVTYPSGRVITYTTSAAGRALSAVDVANSINYATAALYAPPGTRSSLQHGTNIVPTIFYDKRLQPCRISVKTSGTAPTQCSDGSHLGNLLDLTYGYNLGVSDNGNVAQITNNLNSARTQTFSYDSMNRVSTALTQGTSGASCWGLDYSYDVYANLKTVSLDAARPSCPWFTLTAGVDTNNRITNTGLSYDAAGNVLSDGSFSYTWDAESELKTAAGITYTYDGDGRRVQKSNGKLYWYGTTGDILDESDASGNITDEFVFFGGSRIARRNISSGNIYYYLADHLGTSRMIVQAGQTTACYDADFDPFGSEHIVTNTCPQNYKFTGKERDSETGLDDFEARYYSSQFGRFHSADWSAVPAPVPYADLGNPQTLNLYAYVKNNPLNFSDPTGHIDVGRLVSSEGMYEGFRMGAGAGGNDLGCILEGGCGSAVFSVVNNDITYGSLSTMQQSLFQNYVDTKEDPIQPGEKRDTSFYEDKWKDLTDTARANYAAITNAMQKTTLKDGSNALSQVTSVTSIGQMDIGVTWKEGAKDAFEQSGFGWRPGWKHEGENGITPGRGSTGLHLLFGDSNAGVGHVHIDYRGLDFEGHYEPPHNNDVRAIGPEKSGGALINNYERYKSWYGPIPGYEP